MSNAMKIIVGTKSDCDNEKEVTYKEGQRFAKTHEAIFFETSAKDGNNVPEMFQMIANTLLLIKNTVGFMDMAEHMQQSSINLEKKKRRRKRKKKCC